jgi:Tfp pilus assembly protein PilN
VRAVNLIPADARRGGRGDIASLRGPGSAVIGVLVVALVMVVLYVTAANDVSSAQGQLNGLQQQVSQTQALAGKLNGYTQFAALAKARVETVREIASGRFDWEQALSDLSRVVPSNTTLTSLSATAAPGDGTAGGGSSAGGLRGDITAPAFEVSGCTATQDDVARLMSRLRLIRGVTRATLSDAVKSSSGSPSGSSSSGSTSAGCGAGGPTFDLVVFFQPLPTVAAPTTGATGTPASTGSSAPASTSVTGSSG